MFFYREISNLITEYITDGLVLRLDAGNTSSYPGSGTAWNDLTANGNNATLVNGPLYSSRNGGSIVFDGTDDYATIPSVNGITNFTTANNYTVSFWVYIPSFQNKTNNSDNDILQKWNGSGAYPYSFRLYRDLNMIQASAFDGTTASNGVNGNIITDSWNFITAVYNWSSSQLIMYVNGVKTETAVLSLVGNISNNTLVSLARRLGGAITNEFTGRISELLIYNRALTDAEVAQNYNAKSSRYIGVATPSLVTGDLALYLDAGNTSSYPGTGTTWTDLSSNGNNGTLTNGPTFSSANSGSIVFDGVNDIIDNVGTTNSFSFIQNTGIATISFWAKFTGSSLMYVMGNTGTSAEKGFYMGKNANGGFEIGLLNGDSAGNKINITTRNGIVNDTEWHNYTFVINKTTNNVSIYKDGIVVANNGTIGTLSTGTSTRTLVIGKIANYSFNYFKGNLSQVLIYSKALTIDEVAQNFEAVKNRYAA